MRAVVVAGFVLGSLSAVCSAEAAPFTSAFVGRWNLSHGRLLVDIGSYLEAIEAFDTANEMSPDSDVRSEALLQKASVLALFLDEPDQSIAVYDEILAHYPGSPAAESAMLRAAMMSFDRHDCARLARYLNDYLANYPEGQSRSTAELLLARCEGAGAGGGARPTEPPPSLPRAPSMLVRVRVLKGNHTVHVDATGDASISPKRRSARDKTITASAGMVMVDHDPAVREVVVGGGDDAIQVRTPKVSRHFRGEILVQADGDTLVLINRVPLEEYLYGVVTRESVASWPREALRAQAVASRTYAVYQVLHRRDRAYDVVDDEGSQVYGGVEGESAAARRAVDDTRATIIRYAGRPIYAMFTANAGWHTADPKFIFDQPLPYLVAVPDPHSADQTMGRWTRTYSAEEVRSALSRVLGTDLSAIEEIHGTMRCPSGRVVRVAVVDRSGTHEMRTRPTLGRALNLPEILLDIRHEGERFVFRGGGFGHGVGMSQWGAKSMAEKGSVARDILAFYYRGGELATIQ